MLAADHVRNGEILVTLRHDQAVGAYKLATGASQIGTGDLNGTWNPNTNTWDYQGSVIGDIDGVIEVRDENGILLANCTVNGDTEYFGRYNYTVRVNNSGDMYLDVGWNTRDGRTYAADGLNNNTLETAMALPASGTKYTIDSATDVDWFAFTLETPGRSSSYIGIDFKQWAGDLDLELYSAGNTGTPIRYSRSATDNEYISLKDLATGDYYVKVVGYEGNVNEYKLVYNLPEPLVLNDTYESGNDKAHSYHLGKLTEEVTIDAAISSGSDQDYYMFILPKKGVVCDTITLTFEEDVGDLDLYLYGSNGTTLLVSSLNTSGGEETISLAGLKHGVYYAAVKPKSNQDVGNYQLNFKVNSLLLEADMDERVLGNNTIATATSLPSLNGAGSRSGLSIHDDTDVDYYSFRLLETGTVNDTFTLSCEVALGDLDLDILDASGTIVRGSHTAENEDTVSLSGLSAGLYYARIAGHNDAANNYSLSWNVTNSFLIASDCFEGLEPISIREDQTISGLSIARVRREIDETRADTFRIELAYDAWDRSKIILSDYRSDWEDGLVYTISVREGNTETVVRGGTASEISLAGLSSNTTYYLTLDTPVEGQYSEYSLTAQGLPTSDNAPSNTWTFFIYLAGDNNLEGAYLTELLNMQKAILPENVEVYVLMDRIDGYSGAERDWSDTRVGKIRHSNGTALAIDWMYLNDSNSVPQTEWDTGSVDTLEAFLDWGMQAGSAEHYALIVKDHGTSLGYNCLDETSQSMMSIQDVATLLSKNKYGALDVVAFDQCLMGSDVVITTMEGTVDYVVASEAIGWTPNQLVMYKVLLNSLETEMTAQEVAQKIVAACNCSGVNDLTSTSFHTADHTLSSALNAFGEAARGFTRQDWIAICRSFALSYNYGDDICAFSDLGFFLSTIKEYSATVSDTLLTAVDTLYSVVDQLIDSSMIVPKTYGTGLAVFNPVLSSPEMNKYHFAYTDIHPDYYATLSTSLAPDVANGTIGDSAWGKFLSTVGKLAGDCTEFYVDARSNLTFTDFSYSFEGSDDTMQVTYNLGAFSGNGVEYNGLYMDKKALFTVSLDKAGVDGDAIRIVADNLNANITVSLVQTRYTLLGPVEELRRSVTSTVSGGSNSAVLSLAGIDAALAGVDTEYDLIITSDKETTYDMSFESTSWTSGTDFFDYAHSGKLGGQGNGTIEKATFLAAGNYGGLVTSLDDPDFYRLSAVYAPSLYVTVVGTGLTVAEYGTDGSLIESVDCVDGKYTITVANGNYLLVQGNADLSLGNVDSYRLFVNDAESTYLATSGGGDAQAPDKPVVTGVRQNNQTLVSVATESGKIYYYSTDPVAEDYDWTYYRAPFVAESGQVYYFKTVDTAASQESTAYATFVSDGMPTVSITDSVSGNDITLTAVFADNTAVASKLYKVGEGDAWTEYNDATGVTVSGSNAVYFKAIDDDGNETIEVFHVYNGGSTSTVDVELNGARTIIQPGAGNTQPVFTSGLYGGVISTTPEGSEESPVRRNTDITINGGTFSGSIFGGNKVSLETKSKQYFVTADTQRITITDGLVTKYLMGGDYFYRGILERTGDIEINVAGGTFAANSYLMGGIYNRAADDSISGSACLNGNISINITGGSFSSKSWIYGGCVSTSKKKTVSTLARINGDVTITVDSTGVATPIVLCSIIVGSYGWGTITGNAKLVFTGNGDNIQFQATRGELWGSCSGDYVDPDTKKIAKVDSSVEKDRILSFAGFNGQLATTNIRAFSHIEFKSHEETSSHVTLNNANFDLSGFEYWTFENGSSLSGDFANDFTGDTLVLTGFSEAGTYDLITETDITNSETRDVFRNFGALNKKIQLGDSTVTAAFNSTTDTWSWSSGSLALVTENNNQIMRLTIA